MAYEYPPIGATNPEETPAVPASVYDFWVISRIANVIENITDEDPGGSSMLRPHGTLTIRGAKYRSTDGVINPVGETTSYNINDLFEAFTQYPELGTAYNAFVTAFSQLLEIVDNEAELLKMDAATFEQKLINLKTAYLLLNADPQAAKVQECIEKYPVQWTMEECLVHLGLIEE